MKKLKVYFLVFMFILVGLTINLRISQYNAIDKPLCLEDKSSQINCYAKGVANGAIAGLGNTLILIAFLLLILEFLEKNREKFNVRTKLNMKKEEKKNGS